MRKLLNVYWDFGWLGLISIFRPVYWRQDHTLKNKGVDIISLTDPSGCYFYGTLKERNRLLYYNWSYNNHVR